jgi:hypothetical protein
MHLYMRNYTSVKWIDRQRLATAGSGNALIRPRQNSRSCFFKFPKVPMFANENAMRN